MGRYCGSGRIPSELFIRSKLLDYFDNSEELPKGHVKYLREGVRDQLLSEILFSDNYLIVLRLSIRLCSIEFRFLRMDGTLWFSRYPWGQTRIR